GEAWGGLMARPSHRLSPKTNMVFICDESAAGARPTCPQKQENQSAVTTPIRHCLGRLRILLSALTRLRHSRKIAEPENILLLWQITASTDSGASDATFFAPCHKATSNASARSMILPTPAHSRICCNGIRSMGDSMARSV